MKKLFEYSICTSVADWIFVKMFTSPIRIGTEDIGMYAFITSCQWMANGFFFIPIHVNDIFSIFQQITKVNFSKATIYDKGRTFPAPEKRDMGDISLGHTFAQVVQVTCCLLSKVLYSKHQEAVQPSADHISCNKKELFAPKKSFLFSANKFARISLSG